MLYNLSNPKHSLCSNIEKDSKTPRKRGKNWHSDPLNFRMIDFWVALTLYLHLDGVSTIVLRGLFAKFKNFFQKWVLMRGGRVSKMASGQLPNPPQNFFLTFFLLIGFGFSIPYSWYLISSDSFQSISQQSYELHKVASGGFFRLLLFV